MSGSSLQKYVLFSARTEATVIACSSGSRSSRRLPTHNAARARNTATHSNSPCQALRGTIPLLRAAAAAAQPLSLHRLFFLFPPRFSSRPASPRSSAGPTRKGRAERGEGRGKRGGTEDARARKRASQRVMCACCAPAAAAAAL